MIFEHEGVTPRVLAGHSRTLDGTTSPENGYQITEHQEEGGPGRCALS